MIRGSGIPAVCRAMLKVAFERTTHQVAAQWTAD